MKSKCKFLAFAVVAALSLLTVISGGCGGGGSSSFTPESGGDMEDDFFSGAWTCSSNDARVQISTPSYLGDPGFFGDATLLTFGAYFSSVDINTGTASFAAFTVLSSDLVLIPIVFDTETVSVDRSTTSGEYKVKTTYGAFTVSRDLSNLGNLDKINISGSFDYQNRGFIVSVNASLNRFQSSQQLDFDSIMNGSTWQSTPFDSKSGGFALLINLSTSTPIPIFYPGINAKTFANFVFDGDSTGGMMSGFGTMSLASLDITTTPPSFVDSGLMLPVTMIRESMDVTPIFGNYYRFELAREDDSLKIKLKGVFILEDESTARLIMLTEAERGSISTRLYSVFYLHKITASGSIDLTRFNNTSWNVQQAGGIVSVDRYLLQITNLSPDIRSIRINSFDVQFSNSNLLTRTFDFSATASADIPAISTAIRPVAIGTKTVAVESLGAYMWLGTVVNGDSQFILTMSAAYPTRAAIAGDINFTVQSTTLSRDINILAEVLLDLQKNN